VHELFGAERLDGLDASAQPASVAAVAPAGLVERFRPDADREGPPQVVRERGPRVERKRWGAFRLKKGAKYEMTEDPEGEWGDAWIGASSKVTRSGPPTPVAVPRCRRSPSTISP